MNKKNLPNLNPTIISLLISGLGMPSVAMAGNYLDLVQYPAGSSGKEPAPNVIISVDDSGSMGWDTGGCMTPDLDTRYGTRFNEDGAKYVPDNDPTATPTNCPATRAGNTNKSRIRALKDALTAQFGDANATPGTKGSTPIIPYDLPGKQCTTMALQPPPIVSLQATPIPSNLLQAPIELIFQIS